MREQNIQNPSKMNLTYNVLTLLLFAVVLETAVEATCVTKPTLSSNSYTLTEDKKQYEANETYDITCIPGYTISGASVLTCQSSTWSSSSPTCTPSEGTYPWWMLLVAVMVVVLMIACILPRLLVCLCRKSDKKKQHDDESGLQRTHGDDYDDDDDDEYGRSESPPPDLSQSRKNKMSNIEFMAELHKDKDLNNLRRAKKNAVF